MNKVLLSLVLLLSLSSAYAGSCFDDAPDVADCKVKAEQGFASAQFNLGVMYENGKVPPPEYLGFIYGEEQEAVMAHMYYNIAAANGNSFASDNREGMEKRMSSSQIAEAQKLAREWMKRHQ